MSEDKKPEVTDKNEYDLEGKSGAVHIQGGIAVPKRRLKLETLHLLEDSMTHYINEQICIAFEHAEKYFACTSARRVTLHLDIKPVPHKTRAGVVGFDIQLKPASSFPKVPVVQMDPVRALTSETSIVNGDGQLQTRNTAEWQPGSPDDPRQTVIDDGSGRWL